MGHDEGSTTIGIGADGLSVGDHHHRQQCRDRQAHRGEEAQRPGTGQSEDEHRLLGCISDR